MVVCPSVEVKPIESDALFADGDFGEIGANRFVKSISVHSQVRGRISQSDQARQDAGRKHLHAGHVAFFYLRRAVDKLDVRFLTCLFAQARLSSS
jgi:hypothetical protein